MNSCGYTGNNSNSEIFELENGTGNVHIVENVSSRLKEAADVAKRELNTVRSISSTIEILNQKNSSIVIDEISDSRDPTKKYLVVYGGSGQPQTEPLFRDEIGRLRYVYLRNLSDCRVFVKCKLLRIMFHECNNCQISLRAPVVGMAEFFHCNETNINIRIPNDEDIPLTRIESCESLHIYQSNKDIVYLIYLSVNIKGTIIEQESGARRSEYELGRIFWDNQAQILICLSRDEGFISVPMEYVLNDISHHIIVKTPDDSGSLDEELLRMNSREDMFGTTPPVNNSEGAWKKYLDER